MAFNRQGFKDKSRKNKPFQPGQGQDGRGEQGTEIVRVRLPRGKEILGILDQRLGASRISIRCLDGKSRNCRVPGRLRRKLWLREGDVVLIEPWEFDDDKGDVIFKYNPSAIEWLRKRGYLKNIEGEF